MEAVSSFTLEDFAELNFGLGEGREGWEISPHRAAVLIHDTIRYYTEKLPSQVQAQLAENLASLMGWAEEHRVPVLASVPRPAHSANQRGIGYKLWGIGPTLDQTRDFIAGSLQEPGVPLIRKRSLSAFFATDLETELRRLGRDQLVIGGVFTGGGILATGFDALARDLEFFVVADASADLNSEKHSRTLTQIGETVGQVVSLATLGA
ncbi:isochorismatase family protein [Rothia aerolata]|uniref:Phenazine biosynthesis protein PhzD n=1 Tax=Rothia aerolata TaxID=1812262 RepID=A0A917MT82_9MICC|nr:isochorismatase family protein [Rothia aerolata]GGH59239.1 phenazine biosynthesis protein PhzD [Rothia aerolata]